jgi:inorganic pyrophosphatase
MNLQSPFDTLRIEKHAGEYKDFRNPESDYPLKGVTYPVDYGDIDGYLGEDGANLDIFMGHNGTIFGYIKVYRPELTDGEHKFYLYLTEDEERAVLSEFNSVILENNRLKSLDHLIEAIEPFKQST